jgi:hypothetical protein
MPITELVVEGPFELVYTESKARYITSDNKKAFIKELDDHGVAEKHGCYIFALRSSKGYIPWYVGQAARPLAKECMGSHQINKYQTVFANGHKGTPVMFFVCPEGTKKKVSRRIIDEVEDQLIMDAAKRNPDLLNIQGVKPPDWTIRGILHGDGKKLSAEEKDFKSMMGIINSRDIKKSPRISGATDTLPQTASTDNQLPPSNLQ